MASMWRCSSTKFDVLGPVVAWEGTLDHDTVRTYILNSLKLFHQAGFKTTLLCADGASPNLKAFCDLCGTGITISKTNPTFYNPYLNEFISVSFDCPHMLKNLRNCLLSSMEDGPRHFSMTPQLVKYLWGVFERDFAERQWATFATGPDSAWPADSPYNHVPIPEDVDEASAALDSRITFGWQQLIDLRDDINRGRVHGIPNTTLDFLSDTVLEKLRTSSFLKMSVPLVLKILQPRVLVSLLVLIDKLDTQMKITAATFSPDSTEFKEAERPSLQLKATLLYLVAMRKIYVEYGMSDTPIKSEHDPRFVGLVSGLRFFKIWCSDWLRIGPHIAKTTKNRHFLAHISWTELRIHGVATLEYGIRTLARGEPLYPRRFSSSALERHFNIVRAIGRGHGGLNIQTYFIHSAIREFDIEIAILRPWGLHKLDELPRSSLLRIEPRGFGKVRTSRAVARAEQGRLLHARVKRQRVLNPSS